MQAPARKRLIVADCTDCGATVNNKDAAGHYRDRCWSCIKAIDGNRERHVDTCDHDDCPVCLVHADGEASTARYKHLNVDS